ncbi:MAG: hypothetical protein M1481_06410 [Candidatus Thermoplasmatota archaeon]|jgi:hypothetical protein|nr:hypothetical protein [Candidatus Thermoplasmatota archaeon]MCL5962787.1 hypothetical protein [Candidatus Thermoplasmatota archaeon]
MDIEDLDTDFAMNAGSSISNVFKFANIIPGVPITTVFGLLWLTYDKFFKKKMNKSFSDIMISDIEKELVKCRTDIYILRYEEIPRLEMGKSQAGELEIASTKLQMNNKISELTDLWIDLRFYEVIHIFFENLNRFEVKSVVMAALKSRPEEMKKTLLKPGDIPKNLVDMYTQLTDMETEKREMKEKIISILASSIPEFTMVSTYKTIKEFVEKDLNKTV